MPDESYGLFVSQLKEVCVAYPHLRIKETAGRKILKGAIKIENSEKTDSKSYLIEIHWADGFPYKFPILYEVGGDIPCEPDWHKYSSEACCITVDYDENLKCRNGITVSYFVKTEVIPYLANQWHKQVTGNFKAEYSHGEKARFEFLLDFAFGNRKIDIGRNDKCFCGSNKKYKKCHSDIIEGMRKIGKESTKKFLMSKGIFI